MTRPGMKRIDYIVVGGGSAGCVLAARLSEDPAINVVLLEAGDDERKYRRIPMPLAWRDAFRDPDLSAGQYTEAGFYVALRMKFDESLLGLGKQKE